MAPSVAKSRLVLGYFRWTALIMLISGGPLLGLTSVDSDIYLVILKEASVLHYYTSRNNYGASLTGHRVDMRSKDAKEYASSLIQSHDNLLEQTLGSKNYRKLYSYYYLVNGFAVSVSAQQATAISEMPDVLLVERDIGVQKLTTYTPSYLGLPLGAWADEGGEDNAGEGIIIGLIDTGVDPQHPSFSNNVTKPYTTPSKYTGVCEVAVEFPQGSCNDKLIGARHFAKAAIDSGVFNATQDFASPLDGDGHGTHTASTAAGNYGVPVVVAGTNYGFASGMAPRARVAVYKALYRGFGGFFADVVAGVEQAVQDGVDILSLSIGPNSPPSGLSTFLNTFDMALLSAVKAGVFVAQAAGNAGPYPSSILSFSPWICSVASAMHDRTYSNSIILGNNKTITGLGLAPATKGEELYPLVLAVDAVNNENATESNVIACQESKVFNQTIVKGKLLVCYYTLEFLFGTFSIKNVIATAQNLSAEGIVFLTSREVDGHNFGPIPIKLPAIIIPTANDSTILAQYYNESSRFAASARILGGTIPTFSNQAPKVASYSSRGPDVADDKQNVADVLKPNVMAPGSMIWAAWSPIGTDAPDFQGETFAMISGTSMATPHIAGIAALIKQRNPNLSPAGISSALSTTAFVVDKHGNPLLAQYRSSNGSLEEGPGTPFAFGAGAVNPTAALDPGLVFDAGFDDYVNFLCSIPGSSDAVMNFTKASCKSSPGLPTDLNSPFIVVGNLTATRSIPRNVTNIAKQDESYTVSQTEPDGVSLSVQPSQFTLKTGESQQLQITLIPTSTREDPSFGSIVLSGSHSHVVRIPVAVISKTKAPSSYI